MIKFGIFASSRSVSGFDSDAQLFIDAGSFTAGEQTIINQFVLDLKTGLTNGTNVFTKFFFLLPIIGGDASNHSLDLVRNHDTTWVNSPTHDSNGVLGASTKYGDSNFNPVTDSADKDDFAFGFYTNTTSRLVTASPIGNMGSGTDRTNILIINDDRNVYPIAFGANGDNWDNTDGKGLNIAQRTGSTALAFYVENVEKDTNTHTSTSFHSADFFLMARNNNATADQFAAVWEFQLFFAATSFSSNERADFKAAVTAFQTSLSRQI